MSVETFSEHVFIQDWLTENDPSTQRWMTSGQRYGLYWKWAKRTGLFNLQYDQGWLSVPELERQLRYFLVYAFQSILIILSISILKVILQISLDSQWGWLPYDILPAEKLPFICEVPLQETYGIIDSYRGIGMILLN